MLVIRAKKNLWDIKLSESTCRINFYTSLMVNWQLKVGVACIVLRTLSNLGVEAIFFICIH